MSFTLSQLQLLSLMYRCHFALQHFVWNLMSVSHRHHGQDKMDLSCLVRVGCVSWIGDKTRQFCLDPVSNLQLFSLKYIEDYWKLSWLVANAVHTADTDKTRQDSLVLSCPCQWCEINKNLFITKSMNDCKFSSLECLLCFIFCLSTVGTTCSVQL